MSPGNRPSSPCTRTFRRSPSSGSTDPFGRSPLGYLLGRCTLTEVYSVFHSGEA
ncbi:hypothetical protein HPC62_13300 [Thermoleptolyngbya sichuanensis A183]|uniref:Uncharacterized protein n=1 Tax=Thermoleptolyngbya sichuanensis A183 TaxID=2737172 RepID=A0A6M8BFL4_9CYAN|nr:MULTISPECIES: hypothetical protein [Thermoleptolyngbya]QKD83040.1 hypothetical protein HPC62_13300 [Thermoleptolyngbya sichuanensis A183]